MLFGDDDKIGLFNRKFGGYTVRSKQTEVLKAHLFF
jgi:hypothetical protein